MKATVSTLAAAVAALGLAACDTPPTKQEKGTVGGAVIGAAVGSTIGSGSGRTAAIAIGTIAGAVIGRHVGKEMDEADRIKAAQALETAPTGYRSTWKNPDTGAQYVMTPTNTYQGGSGPCREYTVDTTVEGKSQKVRGTACRQADGTWKTVD